MSRPSISLCCIMKDEARNVGPMLQSVRGCFDQIVLVDTGSTDGTLDFVKKINEHIKNKDANWSGLPKIQVEHFEWIKDFAAARNYAFSFATKDYVVWLDLDDALSDAKAFIAWRDSVMHSAHYWTAIYNYSYKNGKPECKFIRERVIKRDYGFKWTYFVHEGLVQEEGRKFWPQSVSSWTVDHRRTDEDRAQDHMRNLNLYEERGIDKLLPRELFYYGKELFENGQTQKAGDPLVRALKSGKLDGHDLILTIQYAAQSALATKAYAQAIDLLLDGLKLVVSRAEYWCLLGDIYLAMGRVSDALMTFKIAVQCTPDDLGGALVIYGHAYGEYPRMQLATVYLNNGDHASAREHVEWLDAHGIDSAPGLKAQLAKVKDLSTVRTDLTKTDDIIITCPPGMAVTDWDEETLAIKGHGGSETAAIEVARWLKLKTNRRVKLFQQRSARGVMASGVEYLPVSELQGYLHNLEPAANISWRHATRLTPAKSFVWCHDLQCPGADRVENYDKIVALSGFHKSYLQETNGVPADKIVLGFNGINPLNFVNRKSFDKDPLKVVFSSSPDRGLVQTIDIVKKARELSGLDIKLHCFYGVENMRKGGQTEWADRIEKHIKDHDFVIYHGNVQKQVLMNHFMTAAVWLYPADFIETYCITAIEALCAGVWPIVRPMGALPFTMSQAIKDGMCDMIDVEVVGDASVGIWANALVDAIIGKKWEKVSVDPKDYSWEKVADFFIKEMGL